MRIETHDKVVESQWSMTPQGLMVILPGNSFYVFMLNMTAKTVNLPSFMIVVYASIAPACIIHARVDKSNMLTDDGSFLMQ